MEKDQKIDIQQNEPKDGNPTKKDQVEQKADGNRDLSH